MADPLDVYIVTVPERDILARRLYGVAATCKDLGVPVMFSDDQRRGAWWNTARVLSAVGQSGRPALILQDDAFLYQSLLNKHLRNVLTYLTQYPAISLVTPSTLSYYTGHKQGYNARASCRFILAQAVLIRPDFAREVVARNTHGDSNFIERRYNDAARATGQQVLTLVGGLVVHDTSVPSEANTKAHPSGPVASPAADFSRLRLMG